MLFNLKLQVHIQHGISVLSIIVSTVNGLDADVWREKNEKRLLLLEKFTLRKKMRIFKFFISEAQREKKICEKKRKSLS